MRVLFLIFFECASAALFDTVPVKFEISMILGLLLGLTWLAIICAIIIERNNLKKEEGDDEDDKKEK